LIKKRKGVMYTYIIPGGIPPPIPGGIPPSAPGGAPPPFDAITSSILRIIVAASEDASIS
jgi:hypothetical protein